MTADSRLRWTDEDEVPRLCAAALPLLVADAHLSVVEAVRRAQQTVLAPDRRRNLVNLGAVPVRLRTMLEQRRAAALGNGDVVPAADLKAAEARTALAQEALTLSEEYRAKLEAQLADGRVAVDRLTEQVRTLTVAAKAQEPLAVIRAFIVDAVREGVDQSRALPGGPRMTPVAEVVAAAAALIKVDLPIGANKKHDPEPRQDERVKPPLIFIIGLMPQRRARMEAEFRDRARFKFYWSERGSNNGTGLEEKARGADVVYCLMGACSHEEVAKAMRANDHVERVHQYGDRELHARVDAFLKRQP